MSAKTVFISYSHDSDEHRARVLGLSERLRSDGIETLLDQYVNGAPNQGWPRWMLDQMDKADSVIVVCTKPYYLRFRGHEEPGKGKGVDWEGALITQEIYDSRSQTLKFVPVFLATPDENWVPEPLRSVTYYTLISESAYQSLYDFLLEQAAVEPGAIGPLKIRPLRKGNKLTFDNPDNVTPPAGLVVPNAIANLNSEAGAELRRTEGDEANAATPPPVTEPGQVLAPAPAVQRLPIVALTEWVTSLQGPAPPLFEKEKNFEGEWLRLFRLASLVLLMLVLIVVVFSFGIAQAGIMWSDLAIRILVIGAVMSVPYAFLFAPLLRIKISFVQTFFTLLLLGLPWVPMLALVWALGIVWGSGMLQVPLLYIFSIVPLYNFCKGIAVIASCRTRRVVASLAIPLFLALAVFVAIIVLGLASQ